MQKWHATSFINYYRHTGSVGHSLHLAGPSKTAQTVVFVAVKSSGSRERILFTLDAQVIHCCRVSANENNAAFNCNPTEPNDVDCCRNSSWMISWNFTWNFFWRPQVVFKNFKKPKPHAAAGLVHWKKRVWRYILERYKTPSHFPLACYEPPAWKVAFNWQVRKNAIVIHSEFGVFCRNVCVANLMSIGKLSNHASSYFCGCSCHALDDVRLPSNAEMHDLFAKTGRITFISMNCGRQWVRNIFLHC